MPSELPRELMERVLEKLANGESLVSICKEEGMPNPATVYRWIERDEDYRDSYVRARAMGVDVMAEEIVTIADDSAGDIVVGEDGKTRVDHEAVQRSKLRVDARKWIVSKLKPNKYGERTAIDLRATVQDMDTETLLSELRDKGARLGIDVSALLAGHARADDDTDG